MNLLRAFPQESFVSVLFYSRDRLFSTKKDYKYLKLSGLNPKNQDSKFGPAIAYISMERSEVHNAFNEELIEEITRAFKTISNSVRNSLLSGNSDPSIPYSSTRAVVFTGSGPSFSAGADLNWMKKMVSYTKKENERDSYLLFDMFHAIKSCPCPVIARVNGPAMGGGAGLVSVADIAFASSSAKFGFTEVKLGLIPAVISPFVLEKIGKGNASRYFLTGEKFSAEEARRIGLVQEHFGTEEEMDKAVKKICEEISMNGPNAVSYCKEFLTHVSTTNMNWTAPYAKTYTAKTIANIRISPEGQSGLTSFFNKKKPYWITK